MDKYFGKIYNHKDYTCLHFVKDVWKEYTGKDISKLLERFFNEDFRKANKVYLRNFKQLEKLEDPCIVVLTRPRTIAHMGIFIRGRVLHLTERGTEYQPLDIVRLGFTNIRFFTC